MQNLADPSSLLFTIEKPNIYRDDHLVPSLLLESSGPVDKELTIRRSKTIDEVLRGGRGVELYPSGPLGRDGNEVICKWTTIFDLESGGNRDRN
jgi:hypothetical protein